MRSRIGDGKKWTAKQSAKIKKGDTSSSMAFGSIILGLKGKGQKDSAKSWE